MGSPNFSNIGKIPELQKRIIFTILMLGVFRVGVHIPTPGIDPQALAQLFQQLEGTLFGILTTFTGGALERFSVFALGIMPYITASIILQLLQSVVPRLEELKKEGEAGRRKITQYTRYGTIVLSLFQGAMIATWLENQPTQVVLEPGWGFKALTILTLTAGTTFLMWLGEQINERGIGNGISLIIFAGIVADMPGGIGTTLEQARSDELGPIDLIVLGLVIVAAVWIIVYFERAQRRIPVQYARRMVGGGRVVGGTKSYLPLKVNQSGVIPPIFASSLLLMPQTVLLPYSDNPVLRQILDILDPTSLSYQVLYVALIIFFCYFWVATTYNPVDVAENLKKNGGYVPGTRPGKATADYLDRVINRITLGGALYVSAVCVLPAVLINRFGVSFAFGGTALLIVVSVAMDTVAQIEAHMLSRDYDGLMGPGGARMGQRGRGRRR